ncbi:GtrA family protein [Luteimonas granuli]|uniref:GtrA family protein n=1 Tax=Luteimonas granuli TaxID=1176533 RepID=A0A518N3J6_9GAMM|nr:GtrA family protein [Luteimonas granuli]QDW66489.1 GtrA family protein [Luteimonas granuli]
MSLVRQGPSYLAIGGIQWLLDWAVMVLLSHLGLRIGLANIVGRVCGALLGFWLNGKFTFTGEGHALGRRQLLRFVAMWLVMTLLSTVAIEAIDDLLGRQWAWLAKPLVEAGLGVLGFVVSRHWIYRL